MSKKHYIASLKREMVDQVPEDWHKKLTKIKGVSILGSSPKQVQFTADDETAEKVRQQISQYGYLEEATDREPL